MGSSSVHLVEATVIAIKAADSAPLRVPWIVVVHQSNRKGMLWQCWKALPVRGNPSRPLLTEQVLSPSSNSTTSVAVNLLMKKLELLLCIHMLFKVRSGVRMACHKIQPAKILMMEERIALLFV